MPALWRHRGIWRSWTTVYVARFWRTCVTRRQSTTPRCTAPISWFPCACASVKCSVGTIPYIHRTVVYSVKATNRPWTIICVITGRDVTLAIGTLWISNRAWNRSQLRGGIFHHADAHRCPLRCIDTRREREIPAMETADSLPLHTPSTLEYLRQ